MTVEELAAIHAAAMTVPAPWGVPTLQGFISATGAVLVTRALPANTETRGLSAPSRSPESISGSMEATGGFALGRVIADEAELLTIAVAPGSQRKGLGRDCLLDFLAACQSKGAQRVFLEVAAPNAPARALYEDAGFRDMGTRRGYYRLPEGDRVDAVLMEKALLPRR